MVASTGRMLRGPALACLALTLSWAFWPGAGGVAAQAALPVDVEAGASREVLTGDQEPWEDYWIRATVRPAPGTFVYGGVRHTRRFGQEDQQLEAGGGMPIAPRWTLRLEGTWSPTQRVLPIWGASGMVSHNLAPGWVLSVGGGRQVWDVTGVNRQHVGVVRHFPPFRLGYRLSLHQVDIGGSGVRHGVTGGWTYDRRGSDLAVWLGTGRDAMIIGPQDVRSVTERSAGVSGTHWLDRNTGIGYNFGIHRHGPHFTRTSSSVGIRRRL